jgi:hypothetical protein
LAGADAQVADTFPVCGHSFRAALLAAVPAIPFAGIVATLAIYAAPAGSLLAGLDPVPAGAIIALIVGLLVSVTYRWIIHGTSADQVNTSIFYELRQRLGDITAQGSVAVANGDAAQVAARQLQDGVRQIRHELETGGPAWIMGTAYVSAWKMIHRAEESLLLLAPTGDVVAGALHDELRLTGAQMDNSDQLLAKLRLAVHNLSAAATGYLSARPGGIGQSDDAKSAAGDPTQELLARAALREVRQTINEFRDGSWEAIVRTRNHLLETLFATGLVTYFGLALAIALNGQARGQNIQSNAIVGAAAFYVVGSIVGLFNRLNAESGTQDDVEDYGLTTARLMLTPVLAGLAAVGGVFLMTLLSNGVSAAVSGNTTNGVVPDIGTIYNVSQKPFGLLLAAVFGLSPTLLISALQDQAEKYKSALKSTAPQASQ